MAAALRTLLRSLAPVQRMGAPDAAAVSKTLTFRGKMAVRSEPARDGEGQSQQGTGMGQLGTGRDLDGFNSHLPMLKQIEMKRLKSCR